MAKQKIELITTPVGTLQYPHLISPDMQENMAENQRKDGGVYNTTIQFDTNDTTQADFVAKLTKIQKDNEEKVTNATPKAKQKSLNFRDIFSIVYDSNDEDTGYVECKLKLDAKVKPKNHEGWEQRPKLFDKDGNFFTGDNIGNGTKARIKLEARPYGNATIGVGVSLRLHQLQVIELVEYVPDSTGGDTFSNGKQTKETAAVDSSDSFEGQNGGDF